MGRLENHRFHTAFCYLLNFVFLNFFAQPSWAISENLSKTLNWEYNANSANNPSERPSQKQRIYHYEIPVESLNDFGYEIDLPPKIRSAIFFDKMVGGQKKPYVRWIINPEDTKHHMKVRSYLEKKGLDSFPKQYFKGYMTSSRSIFLEDPNTGAVFSAKVSTNKTGGKFKDDKKLTSEDIFASKHSNILAYRTLKKNPQGFSTLKLLTEPIGLYLSGGGGGLFSSGAKQGFLIRDLEPLNNGNTYIPGFAALHEEVGKEIALLNGSNNPEEFWAKHYAEPLGTALAELSAYFGFAMTSAHNQQFLIELDKNMKPTGKIVLRDFNDSHVFSSFYQATGSQEDKDLKAFFRRKDHMIINFGLFHGVNLPTWVNQKDGDVKTMVNGFYKKFDQRYSEITGIPLYMFSRKRGTANPPPRYSIKVYDPSEAKTPEEKAAWNRYLLAGDCFRGADKLPDGRDCSQVMKEFAKWGQIAKNMTHAPNGECKPAGEEKSFFNKLFN